MVTCAATTVVDQPSKFHMATRENISVSFTPHQAEFLAACVASGRYQSMSEVVREGAGQLDRGEVIDGETFFREWDEELDALDAGQRRKAAQARRLRDRFQGGTVQSSGVAPHRSHLLLARAAACDLVIAAALGDTKLCVLRNHGLLTVGSSIESAIGWFVMAERVAEVHVKAPDGRAISDEAAAVAAATMSSDLTGWRIFQWLRRSLDV